MDIINFPVLCLSVILDISIRRGPAIHAAILRGPSSVQTSPSHYLRGSVPM
jgi:hypothetical protein